MQQALDAAAQMSPAEKAAMVAQDRSEGSQSPASRSNSPAREPPAACQSANVIAGEYTNAKVMLRALTFTLLAADVRRREREAAIRAIRDHPNVQIFLALLTNERSHTFRGLYRVDDNFLGAYKIFGRGPDCVAYSDVNSFLKYNMSKKVFDPVNTSNFSVGLDAMVLYYKKRQWYTKTHDDDEETTYAASTYASEAKTNFTQH